MLVFTLRMFTKFFFVRMCIILKHKIMRSMPVLMFDCYPIRSEGPGPMWGLGLVQCSYWAWPKVGIGPGPMHRLGQTKCIIELYKPHMWIGPAGTTWRLGQGQCCKVIHLSPMHGLGLAQCSYWAWSKGGIGPG